MKAKGFKLLSTIILAFGTMLCGLVGLSTPTSVSAAALNDVEANYHMKTELGYVSTANHVGNTSGYGTYEIGEEAQLTATANTGYNVVAWKIDHGNGWFEVNPSVKTQSFTVQQDGLTDVTVTFEATFNIVSGKKVCEESVLKISKVFDHIKATPIYGYNYYNLDVAQMKSYVDDSKLDLETYEQYVPVTPATEKAVTNAKYITKDSFVYYFEAGTLFYEEGGEGYYVYQNGDKVDCIQGAYKLNDEVNIATAIKETSLIQGTGLKVKTENTSVSLGIVGAESALAANKVYFGNSSKNLLNKTSAQFDIIHSDDLVNSLELNFHQVYTTELVYKLNGTTVTDSTIASRLASVTSVENFVYQEDNIYYVKHYINNDQQVKFTISSSDYYYSDGVKQYKYYDLAKIADTTKVEGEGSIKKTFDYSTDANRYSEIVVDFVDHQYKIDFKFALQLSDGSINDTIVGAYNVNDPEYLAKGEQVTLVFDADEANNIGYQFVGFTLRKDRATNETITHSMNADKPEDVTYLMVFKKIEYTVTIANANSISLTQTVGGTPNSVYPNPQVTLTSTIKGSDNLSITGQTGTFATIKVGIDEVISLKGRVVDGFILEGFYSSIDGTTPKNKIENGILTLNEEYIANYVGNALNVTVYVQEEYASYSLNYIIEETSTGVKDASQNFIKTIMATISATNPDASKNYITIGEVNKSEAGKHTITISGLHKFDIVNLVAKANTVAGGSGVYKFIRFTADGVSSLTSGLTENDKDAQKYTYAAEVITNNTDIIVVYSMPNTDLTIEVTGYADALIVKNITVSENGRELNSTYPTFIISAGDYVVSFNGAVKTGAYIKSVVVTKKGTADEVSVVNNGSGIYSFTITTSADYVLTVNIQKYEYAFLIYENDVLLDTKTLDIENRTLEFTKTKGYYVSKVAFGSGKVEYKAMNETNSTEVSDTYSYGFAPGELENIASYGVQDVGNIYKYNIEMHIVTAKHMFNITITNKILNAKGNSNDDKIGNPDYTITYEDESGDDVVIIPSVLDYDYDNRAVTLKGIPYGTPFVIDILNDEGFAFGVEVVGWTDQTGNSVDSVIYTVGADNVTATGIQQNQNLFYNVKYVEYALHATFDSTQGNPSVEINGSNSNKVTLFDRLNIDTAYNTIAGYVLDCFVYNAVEEYSYTIQSKWLEDYDKVYVRENNIYVLNTDPNYYNNKKYFVKVEEEIEGQEVLTFDPFDPSEVFVDENGFFVEINYKLREVKIVNVSKCDTSLSGFSVLNIPTSEFATYTVSQYMGKDGSGNEIYRPLNADELVNKNYLIKIEISINDNAQNGILNEFFNLREGVYLKTARSDDFIITEVARGEYVLKFNMADIMGQVYNDELNIEYEYFVEARELVVTTNVHESTDPTLLADFNTNVNMSIIYGEFGTGSGTSGGTGKVSDTNIFLAKTTVTYTLSGSYDSYVRISDLQLFDIDTGAALTAEEAGVEVQKSGNAITSITVRYLRNVKMVLTVTPLITVNGYEISAGDVPPVTVPFKPDKNGLGIAQTIDSFVEAVPLVKNAIIIGYKDQNGFTVNEPTNAGTYDVQLSFNSSEENYKWLNRINVSSKITFIIEKLDINVDYDVSKVEKIKKQYNQKSDYSAGEILNYLRFTDNKGFVLTYTQIQENHSKGISSFVLDGSKYRAFISRTEQGVQVETAQANEKAYYNITLANLELVDYLFNNNYNLVTSELSILECIQITRKVINIGGVVANDKVYDGTTLATLSDESRISVYGICTGDDLTVNRDKILLQFVDSKIDDNKVVTVDASSALEGEQAGNYTIKTMSLIGRTIYPYELKAEVANIGNIIVRNDVGLTDPTKANLIPLNATLSIKLIEPDSAGYAEIYPSISKFLSRTKVFAVGFRLSFENEDGTSSKLSKELSFAVPTIENLKSVICLDGTFATEVEFEEKDGVIYLNLANLESGVRDILLTEKRALLPLWAIILIVVGGVAVIGGGVTAFILVRRKKMRNYSVNDKI